MVDVAIAAYDAASSRDILDFLAAHGVTSPRTTGTDNSNIFARFPASLLRALSERSDISYMRAKPLPYPRMNADPNGLAVRYAAGLLPDADTEPTFARLVIDIEGDDNYDAIKQFLIDGGAVMAYGDVSMGDTYKPYGMVVAYAPVRLFEELAGKPGIFEVDHEWYPVPPELRLTDHGEEPAGNSKSTNDPESDSGRGVRVPVAPPPVLRPAHADVANAIGAAIAQVGGQVERVYALEQTGREPAIADYSAAVARVVAAASSVEVVEIDEGRGNLDEVEYTSAHRRCYGDEIATLRSQ